MYLLTQPLGRRPYVCRAHLGSEVPPVLNQALFVSSRFMGGGGFFVSSKEHSSELDSAGVEENRSARSDSITAALWGDTLVFLSGRRKKKTERS